ncbi:unnamed protein product, partial [Didymodactylos carnosus]
GDISLDNQGALTYLNDAKDFLLKLKEKNEKKSNVICIAGLEKCGKSTFINALLGFELLPNNIKRCTQITTELRPIDVDKPKLLVTYEFYSQKESETLLRLLKKKSEESDEEFQEKHTRIREIAFSIQQNHQEQTTNTSLQENTSIRVIRSDDGPVIEEDDNGGGTTAL